VLIRCRQTEFKSPTLH